MSAIIAVEGPDSGVPWHFGEPLREQRLLESPGAAVDLSHRGVLTVSGPDRLGWLHSLTTQYLEGLAPGVGVTTLVLSRRVTSSTPSTVSTTGRRSGPTPNPAPQRPPSPGSTGCAS